jgi:uncharacterized protein DUF4232
MTPLRSHLTFAAVLIAALVFAGVALSKTGTTPACKGSQLSGSFNAVRGSEGAGNIVYRLTLTNTSATACTLTGLPAGQLLGKTGKKLPTHIRAAKAQALTAVLVTLAHGKSAHADARFSPDVPGVGEQMTGQCEAKSFSLRVSLKGGGTTTVKITPATPVCEKGQLSFSAYVR